MVDGYTKLFSSIIHSTVWQEQPHVKIVWVTLLAMSDQHGEVKASIPGLAKAAGVDIAQCEDALHKFQSPDPYSRTKDHEGRRIEECDGGWALLNHAKYRHMQSHEDQKAKNAARQRKFREEHKPLRNVTRNEMSRMSLQAEAEEEAKEEAKEKNTTRAPKGARKRRSWTDVEAYTDGTRTVVESLMAVWPKKQPDDRDINCDQFKMADRVQELLKNPALTPELLVAAAKAYLQTRPKAWKAPQFFFGPGAENEQPPWRPYASALYRDHPATEGK